MAEAHRTYSNLLEVYRAPRHRFLELVLLQQATHVRALVTDRPEARPSRAMCTTTIQLDCGIGVVVVAHEQPCAVVHTPPASAQKNGDLRLTKRPSEWEFYKFHHYFVNLNSICTSGLKGQ